MEAEGRRAEMKQKMGGAAIVEEVVRSIIQCVKDVKWKRESGGRLLVFAVKVAGVELIRKGCMATCPPLWKAIQSAFLLLHATPFRWLLHRPSLTYLRQGTQIFSKPLLFLSVATTITSFCYEEKAVKEDENDEGNTKDRSTDDTSAAATLDLLPTTLSSPVHRSTEEGLAASTLALLPRSLERVSVNLHHNGKRAANLRQLKEELDKAGVTLLERITDDELDRFFMAADGIIENFVSLVKSNVHWRERFYILTIQELESWTHLVFWHGCDMQLRPSLVIHLGRAYALLNPDDRPRFVQAIVSQVEYGVLNLLHKEDPRIVAILDCEGVDERGFPLHMMRSCCLLLQENYPTRLAILFVVNCQQDVSVIDKAVFQILKPATREKILFESVQCTKTLFSYHGGAAYVPNFLGGSCVCSHCRRAISAEHNGPIMDEERISNEFVENKFEEKTSAGQQHSTDHQKYNMLRAIILGILMLWLVVALIASLNDLMLEPPSMLK